MRYRSFIKSLTPWLTLYLLVVSLGMPLQWVSCACAGEKAVALAGSEHECDAHGLTQLEKAEQKKNAPHKCCAGKEEPRQKDCCSSEVIVAAFHANFVVEPPARFVPPVTVPALPVRLTAFLLPPTRPDATHRPVRGPTPPDPPGGRRLLIAHQTFLI